jgi:hypothetical protein
MKGRTERSDMRRESRGGLLQRQKAEAGFTYQQAADAERRGGMGAGGEVGTEVVWRMGIRTEGLGHTIGRISKTELMKMATVMTNDLSRRKLYAASLTDSTWRKRGPQVPDTCSRRSSAVLRNGHDPKA